jgi:hypothetical protein
MAELREKSVKELLDYLLDHEVDIAYKENDFGDLTGVFEDILGRPPERK